MLDREQRELLVVPYAPPPPPRRHLILGPSSSSSARWHRLLGLAIADYSAVTTAWLVVIATLGFLIAARAAHQRRLGPVEAFRSEMERAVEPIPVQPVDGASESIEAV